MIHIKSVSGTAVLSWESIARHATIRVCNKGASIVDLVSAVTFSTILDTHIGVRIKIALGGAELGAHQSVVDDLDRGQRANLIAFCITSNALAGDAVRCNRWLMDRSP